MQSNRIYAIVGVNGGGKTTMLDNLVKEAEEQGTQIFTVDFSDGIRHFVEYMMFGEVRFGKTFRDEFDYNTWKNSEVVRFTECSGGCQVLTGRKLLERVGEGFKIFSGAGVWADYAVDSVIECMRKHEADEDCSVIFGSVRFAAEVFSVIRMAEIVQKPISFLFCNYNQAVYRDPNGIHPSEALGNMLLKDGDCKHGDDVTQKVIELYNQCFLV